MARCLQKKRSIKKRFLLENLVTVADFHPSFDEADYTLVQERESRFLQENFSVAKLCMHLLCWQEHKIMLSNHFTS